MAPTGPTSTSPVSPDTQSAQTPSIPTPSVAWRGCGEGDFFEAGSAEPGKVQCALVDVPLDYANLTGGSIELAVAQLPATEPGARVLFVNPGGPGASATQAVRDLAESAPPELLAAYTLIGVDPRGIQGVSDYTCTADEEFDVDSSPETDIEWAFLGESYRALGQSCRERQPSLSAQMSTVTAARDLESIRRGLGSPQVDYLGFRMARSLATDSLRNSRSPCGAWCLMVPWLPP